MEGGNRRFWDDDNIDRLADRVKDFKDVAFFDAFWIWDGINKGREVAGFEVVFGEVAVEIDFAVELDAGLVHFFGSRVMN